VRWPAVVGTVSRLSTHRRADFRKGTRLGADDHLVVWKKPTPAHRADRRTYNALPETIAVREALFRVDRRGFRTRSVVVTTLLDPAQATQEELVELYRARWHAELDLRSLGSAMQISELRGKTPEMARKEVWAHVLAYNLIRTMMAQAAADQLHGGDADAGGVPTAAGARPVRDAASRSCAVSCPGRSPITGWPTAQIGSRRD